MNTASLRLLALAALALSAPVLHAQNTHRANMGRAQSQHLFVNDSPSLSITRDMTIECWLKFSTLPAADDGMVLFSDSSQTNGNRGLVHVLWNSGGTYYLGSWLTNNDIGWWQVDWGGTPPIGEWTHVAVVYRTSGVIELIVNGVSRGIVSTGVTSLFNVTGPFRIGYSEGGDDWFNDSIDDVRVWAVARTQAQVRATMFNELLGTESDLRAYWKLNNSLADSSSNANALTNVNAATFATNNLFESFCGSSMRTAGAGAARANLFVRPFQATHGIPSSFASEDGETLIKPSFGFLQKLKHPA